MQDEDGDRKDAAADVTDMAHNLIDTTNLNDVLG